MADNFSSMVSAGEFQHPDLISNEVIDLAKRIRAHVGRPMFFTLKGGINHHPGGDARFFSPSSDSFSLHYINLDHNASFINQTPVMKDGEKCKALDFDIEVEDCEDFLDLAIQISGIVGYGCGLGIYPAWQNAGFHIDVRGTKHPLPYARWWAEYADNGNQIYHNGFGFSDATEIYSKFKDKF